MTHRSFRRRMSPAGGWTMIAALSASLVLIPGAASPALADHDHHGHGHYRGYDYGHGPGYAYYPAPVVVRPYPVAYYSPIRVHYYRPRIAPTFYYLPSPYVVVHGPSIAAQVVYYPTDAPVIYAPGYCPNRVHYHPYYPEPGVHGSVSIGFGF